MDDLLKRVLEVKQAEVRLARSQRALSSVRRQAEDKDDCRGFLRSLKARLAVNDPAVIAEIKKASPSRGLLCEDFHPAQIAQSYEGGGAACLSVLTDVDFFQGADADLVAAREACLLPVLRKDFMIDPYQIFSARALGADCILLIVAALDRVQLKDLEDCAIELNLDVLIEIHDRYELDEAMRLRSPLLGINNRDLRTFETRLETTYELFSEIPDDRLVVTESGIKQKSDVASMREKGVHTFLVGEAFMKTNDPGAALKELFF